MGRPNPDGWKGGSEDFKCLWGHYGHRVESPGLHFCDDDDSDAGFHAANVGRHEDYPEWYGHPGEDA